MGNYLDLFEDVTIALRISRDLVSLLMFGGFISTKYFNNADKITLAMDPENYETTSFIVKELCNGTELPSHVLGLKWDHAIDTLAVSRGVNRPLAKEMNQ